MRRLFPFLTLAVLAVAGAHTARAGTPDTLGTAAPGTLEFAPEPDSLPTPPTTPPAPLGRVRWLSASFGERLLTEPEAWSARSGHHSRLEPIADYNRVDLLRVGLAGEVQDPSTSGPRVGGRFEYATGRRRALYGVQLEQPLLPHARLAVGVSMSRRTDHSELQQVDDTENSLALLFARQDYRDYFERDGYGAYVAWRIPDFSTVSVHGRHDTYRSLERQGGTRSLFLRHRTLRDNPPVDEGDVQAVILRLERQARRTARTRAGLYHWIEIEWAGQRLGGDFAYTRALADVRSVLRLSPTATLALRAAGGTTLSGALPAQKEFTAGGVDGLRAHAFSQYRGDQLLLTQAEYNTALVPVRPRGRAAAPHVIAFVDAGRAWNDPGHAWDVARQHLQVDAGLGLATAEDNLRIYVARNLQQPHEGAVVSARLRRPF